MAKFREIQKAIESGRLPKIGSFVRVRKTGMVAKIVAYKGSPHGILVALATEFGHDDDAEFIPFATVEKIT